MLENLLIIALVILSIIMIFFNLHALNWAGWRSDATEKAALPCQKATLAGLCKSHALFALDSCGVFTRRCLPGDALPARRIA